MITGIGNYVMCIGTQVYPISVSTFTLTPNIITRKFMGKNYCTGIKTPCSNDIVGKTWILNLTVSGVDFDSLSFLNSVISESESTPITSEQCTTYSGGPLPNVFYNTSNPGIEPIVGDILITPSTTNTDVLSYNFDNEKLELDHKFYGAIYNDGEICYVLKVNQMRRVSGSSIGNSNSSSVSYILGDFTIRNINQNLIVVSPF